MCLGVPGKVVEVNRFEDLELVGGKVDFGGVLKEVNLSYTPEVEVGQWVVVHVGFSLSILDEAEARQTLRRLQELGEVEAEIGPIEEGAS
jgi:hydrogenase expression/formation protein HypC